MRILDEAACNTLSAHVKADRAPPPADWSKGRAVTDRVLYDCATNPALVGHVAELIGDDFVLWGVDVLVRIPGQAHHWHTDIESSAPDGGFVSVWLGLENTSRASTLQMVSGSHLLGTTLQQARQDQGLRRGEAAPDEILGWARQTDRNAELIQPDCRDGDALLFDGRLWHGSLNVRAEGTRIALLIQFARADQAVFIPDLTHKEWPFRRIEVPRPPVILVRGAATAGTNRLVSPPPALRSGPLLSSVVQTLDLPLRGDKKKGRKSYKVFKGSTAVLDDMASHVSVLSAGQSPHPPHSHIEEELLVLIEGEAEVVIARDEDDPEPRIEALTPGMFIYYPSYQHHTIRNVSRSDATYLMFKWTSDRLPNREALATSIFSADEPADAVAGKARRSLFEGATGCLGRLHAHATRLEPGGGYEAHVDPYDVAIVLLAGEIRSQGQTARPMSVLFFAAGEPHDMANIGPEPARYLVFEFHGPGVVTRTKGSKRDPVAQADTRRSTALPKSNPAAKVERPSPLSLISRKWNRAMRRLRRR